MLLVTRGTIRYRRKLALLSKNTPDLSYRRLVRQGSKINPSACKQTLRLAILSDAATQQFVPLFRTLFFENDFGVEVYEGAFDAIELEVINPTSGLYAFKPDVIVVASSTQALRSRFYSGREPDFVEAALGRMVRTWDALAVHSSAYIVQFNFALPYERHFGQYDLKVPHSLYSTVANLNGLLAQRASERGNVLLCDVEAICSYVGRGAWFDERLWNMSKTFCSLEFVPRVAQAVVEIVLATRGRVVKCVVLDLDNTCWGGVVGDDGPHGILIGAHGDGEAFYHFQQFLLALKQRGILLTVCSKNNHETALQPFLENPEMVLKRDDITVFVANWDDKATNIRKIRDTLEIGFDSMVFLDDNPFERNLVREFLPDVIVPELPEDPADYVRAISDLNLFETVSFSTEDVSRSALYKQEADRRELQSNFSNVEEFLKSLDMRIEVSRFEPSKIPRIAQLIQRSNQFNLTTHRYSEADCERMMLNTEEFIPLYAALSDRFGDHGLISVVVLHRNPVAGCLQITDWLMSCRVLVRGVEQYLMNRVVLMARDAVLHTVTGEYIPTAKNAMVKEFFAQFGFAKESDEGGRSMWSLRVSSYQPKVVYINELVVA